jgi:hypothetical protein
MPYGTVNADVIQTSTSGGILGAGNASIMKNRLINGAMVIDQRNAGASVTANDSVFPVDRFFYYAYVNGKGTLQQNAGSVTTPTGFKKYLGFTSTSAYSIAAGESLTICQKIEGFNTADLDFGTANAKTITVSALVYSSLTGTFGGSVQNSARNRSYPFSYTISTANTWTQISVTIAGDTSGTWIGATNGVGMYLHFSVGAGATYSGTAGAWAGADYQSATGATSVVGTNGATFYITGVQLEVGSSATGFEYVNYQTSIANCQRYYTQFGLEQASSSLSQLGVAYQATTAVFPYILPVKMRSQPTVSASTTELVEWQTLNTYTPTTYTLPTAQQATQSPLVAVNISPSSLTAGRVYTLRATSTAGYIAFISEL